MIRETGRPYARADGGRHDLEHVAGCYAGLIEALVVDESTRPLVRRIGHEDASWPTSLPPATSRETRSGRRRDAVRAMRGFGGTSWFPERRHADAQQRHQCAGGLAEETVFPPRDRADGEGGGVKVAVVGGTGSFRQAVASASSTPASRS